MAAIATPSVLAFFSLPAGAEWIVILVIGLLLFGRRLPDVGRSIGQGIKEFKKGLKDVEEDVRKDEPARKSLPQDQTMSTPEGTRERSQTH
jgi:sec-independent protein translocase protein TatA